MGRGVLVLVLSRFAPRTAVLQISSVAERIWILMHTNQGPVQICAWYRPPRSGEVDIIKTLLEEFYEKVPSAIGTIMLFFGFVCFYTQPHTPRSDAR